MNIRDMSVRELIKYFNLETKKEFDNLYTDRDELMKHNKWVHIRNIEALHSKYSPEQQIFALKKCNEIGIRATSRLLGVSRRTLQRWCKRYNIVIPRYPAWMDDWRKRKIRKRNFWNLRGF